jgi:NAD(P)-dependent dehydrogenase (short-subunit alcohol dehydrogenase family)
MTLLTGATAVVTGASRGIGRATALALAGAGAEVSLWARDEAALGAVATEIAARGGRAHVMRCDVTDPAAILAAAAAVRRALPRVSVLVNNAGAALRRAAIDTTDDDWHHTLTVNAGATFRVTRAFLPDLTRGGGRIINVASIAGRQGTPLFAAYCAAKHAVVGLTRALAVELRAAKVCVNAICPGSVDTAMLREAMPERDPDMSPDDIARTALFLATAAPDALTGACIDVFG